MRIGYVLKKFPRISETFILNEILELQRQGDDVTVFSLLWPDDGVFHDRLSELRNPVVYLGPRKSQAMLDRIRTGLPLLRRGRDVLFDELADLVEEDRSDVWSILRWGFEVALEVQARGIDRLHSHFATVATYVTRVAHGLSGAPYSFTCHAKDIYREGVDPGRFHRLVERAEFAVTVCEANQSYIRQHLYADLVPPIVPLYNGVDLRAFHPRDRRADAEPLVLGVGRLVEKKGFRHLIDAAGRLLDSGETLRCVIVGEGDERPDLERRIRELGTDRIELCGARTHEHVRDLLCRAALLALPCVIGADGNRDALPTVLLEALACGVPVISTPIVGVAEILDGGRAGLLVPPGDAAALADSIARLLHDGSLRESLAARGRARAEELFDLRKNVGTLAAWFRGGVAQREACP